VTADLRKAYNLREGGGPWEVCVTSVAGSPKRGASAASGFRRQLGMKSARRIVLFVVILTAAFYFIPIAALIFVICGALDVCRHRKVTYEMIEKYFMGNGTPTWLLSPLNLLADLLSHPNKGKYSLADLPAEHRAEIEACVHAFRDSREAIRTHIAATIGQSKRCMLTFKWYNATQTTQLNIPAFGKDYRYIKTIAVSVFNTRERTSWHFGPLRLTFRVLYNLDPIDSDEVFIAVDDMIHYWKDDPLFIFDDTMFHRSVNDVDQVRYCLFMDIIRPNYAQHIFQLGVHATSIVAASFKRVFYKNWSFVR
jgi:aspartyl/asparaginyl beta-hydroxylase (cupin superfamily)